MNKEEARRFYEVKHTRARGKEQQLAYHYIRRIIWEQGDIPAIKAWITDAIKNSDNSVRRAIYRKALRELDI